MKKTFIVQNGGGDSDIRFP